MHLNSRIFIAGHRGLVGSALVRRLKAEGFTNLILAARDELDLLDQAAVRKFFQRSRIHYVINAAGRVGGIQANLTYPADFLYENLVIATNLAHAALKSGVEKFLYLGSSCIYPKDALQPIQEDQLLRGAPEPTNEAYAVAKIAGLKLCEYFALQYGRQFLSAMPTNLYGPGDNFHPESSHVIPALLRRFHEAKVTGAREVQVWGTGRPRREFLYVDDLAEAVLVLMKHYQSFETINIGSGEECSISELAQQIAKVTGFQGRVVFDPSKPVGMPRKRLNIEKIRALGWKAQTSLEEGLIKTYRWACDSGTIEAQAPTISTLHLLPTPDLALPPSLKEEYGP